MKRNLKDILSTVLKNGHDRSKKNFRRTWLQIGDLLRHITFNQALWAEQYCDVKKAHPYRFDDDMGENP